MVDHTTDESPNETIARLCKGIRFGMLTTVDASGTLVSRPMALQEADFDGDFWFFSERNARKAQHIAANPHVNIGLTSSDTWLSVYGSAETVDDEAKKKELWNQGVQAWFPDGPEDPNVVLLRVRAESAEYWDTPGGRLASLLSFAKARITGQRYDGGENERVDLG